jgi:hypothetical protein
MGTPVITKSYSPLPSDYSFNSFNQLGKDIIDKLTLSMSGDFTLLSQGETTPADTAYLWYNYTDQRIYRFYGNTWIARHPIPPNSPMRNIWVGTEAQLSTYDDGNSSEITDSTGPFWEVDTILSGKFIVGVGTLMPSEKDIALGDTGGADEVILDIEQMPLHSHRSSNGQNFVTDTGQLSDVNLGSTNAFTTTSGPNTAGTGGDIDGETVAHPNLPPYYAAYYVKRTSRVYYTSTGIVTSAPTGAAGLYFGTGAPAFAGGASGALYVDISTRDVYVWDGTNWGIGA